MKDSDAELATFIEEGTLPPTHQYYYQFIWLLVIKSLLICCLQFFNKKPSLFETLITHFRQQICFIKLNDVEAGSVRHTVFILEAVIHPALCLNHKSQLCCALVCCSIAKI